MEDQTSFVPRISQFRVAFECRRVEGDHTDMERIGTQILTFAIAALVSLLLTGCSDQQADQDLPPLLKIGILPDETQEKLIERNEPLRRHLSASLGLPCELVFYKSYDAMLESFGAGNVDLAYFGGLSFVQARIAYVAVPLVMRDVDTRFTSYFVARADATAKGIADYEDSVLAFGSRLSTSGHLMPRHYLAGQGIIPETFFRDVRYSGTHDKTIEWVRDGEEAIGAVNSRIFSAMVADGRIDRDEFDIVWETPPYANYVWAVQSRLGETGRRKLRDAFLVLSPNREEHDEILKSIGAGGLYPADVEVFSDLEAVASQRGYVQ
jgi:phosphonate transport system substrate-binding protein